MADRVEHGGSDKALARFCIGDIAADSGALPTGRGRLRHRRKREKKKENT